MKRNVVVFAFLVIVCCGPTTVVASEAGAGIWQTYVTGPYYGMHAWLTTMRRRYLSTEAERELRALLEEYVPGRLEERVQSAEEWEASVAEIDALLAEEAQKQDTPLLVEVKTAGATSSDVTATQLVNMHNHTPEKLLVTLSGARSERVGMREVEEELSFSVAPEHELSVTGKILENFAVRKVVVKSQDGLHVLVSKTVSPGEQLMVGIHLRKVLFIFNYTPQEIGIRLQNGDEEFTSRLLPLNGITVYLKADVVNAFDVIEVDDGSRINHFSAAPMRDFTEVGLQIIPTRRAGEVTLLIEPRTEALIKNKLISYFAREHERRQAQPYQEAMPALASRIVPEEIPEKLRKVAAVPEEVKHVQAYIDAVVEHAKHPEGSEVPALPYVVSKVPENKEEVAAMQEMIKAMKDRLVNALRLYIGDPVETEAMLAANFRRVAEHTGLHGEKIPELLPKIGSVEEFIATDPDDIKLQFELVEHPDPFVERQLGYALKDKYAIALLQRYLQGEEAVRTLANPAVVGQLQDTLMQLEERLLELAEYEARLREK